MDVGQYRARRPAKPGGVAAHAGLREAAAAPPPPLSPTPCRAGASSALRRKPMTGRHAPASAGPAEGACARQALVHAAVQLIAEGRGDRRASMESPKRLMSGSGRRPTAHSAGRTGRAGHARHLRGRNAGLAALPLPEIGAWQCRLGPCSWFPTTRRGPAVASRPPAAGGTHFVRVPGPPA